MLVVVMRRAFCIAATCLLLFVSRAEHANEVHAAQKSEEVDGWYCPHTYQLNAEGKEQVQTLWFAGAIGDAQVRMYVESVGSGAVGLFYYAARSWDPVLLGGDSKNGVIRWSATTKDHHAIGVLEGRMSDGRIEGTWTLQDHRAEPVRLKAAEEFKCDGAGPWKRFDDPNWPVTFSYPAAWHLRDSSDSIARSLTLTCPDPATMAYDNEITIWEGTGKPGKNPEGFQGDLVMCASGWRYGCKCDDQTDACREVGVKRKPDRTVLNLDEGEWRTYCVDGGYVGQGDGEDRVVVFRDRWIEVAGMSRVSEIVERLASTAQTSGAQVKNVAK